MPSPAVASVSSTHARVLDAACALFVRDGYRVSMNAVAHRAGVAKQTVYAHFESKDGLFRAAARALVEPLHTCLQPDDADLVTFLTALARQYMRYVNTTEAAALCRMLGAQAPLFPRLAADMYRHGMGLVLTRLAERLQAAMDTGDLRHEDPLVAAELFLSMIGGLEPQRSWCGVGQRGPTAQDNWTRNAVHMFVRLYTPDSPLPAHHQRTSS